MFYTKEMRIGLVLVSFLFVILFPEGSSSQTPEWYSKVRNVRLFETSRSEVERLFDGATVVKTFKGAVGLDVDYLVGKTTITIVYSNGFCVTGSRYGYNVPKDVVIGVEVQLNKPIKFSLFDFDISKFRKAEVEDVVGLFTYTDEVSGIEFSGSSTRLSTLTISPSKEQERLACENIR